MATAAAPLSQLKGRTHARPAMAMTQAAPKERRASTPLTPAERNLTRSPDQPRRALMKFTAGTPTNPATTAATVAKIAGSIRVSLRKDGEGYSKHPSDDGYDVVPNRHHDKEPSYDH